MHSVCIASLRDEKILESYFELVNIEALNLKCINKIQLNLVFTF